MRITSIRAHALVVPTAVLVPGVGEHREQLGCCVVVVETDEGYVGHGLTGITQEAVVKTVVNEVLAPALIGTDPMLHEARWEQMYWMLSSRGQTGYAQHAMAALDIALWDIKGHALQQPIWKLLGGARSSVPVYSTFGFDFLSKEELITAAKSITAQGLRHLKMVVGHRALQRRDTSKSRELGQVIRIDAERVRAVREAVSADTTLYIDANCSLDAYHAGRLASMVADCGIGFFEEPVTQNDASALAHLRRTSGIPVTCGQNEGLAHRFKDWLVNGSVDYLQPNVVISGGFTQCARIAALASAFNVNITNGGAFPLHNMHLQAGVSNGTKVEWHLPVVALMEEIYEDYPVPQDGEIALTDKPGLGFSLRSSALEQFAI